MNLIKCLSHTKWGADQKNLIKIHRIIVLRYTEEAYGTALKSILKKLGPTLIRGLKLALELFVICRTGNILCEINLTTLAEMRESNNVKTTIRIITNPRQPIRPFFVNPNRTDESAYRPETPKPVFVRASETLGKLQMDPKRIEKTPPHIRPPWIETIN
jgi:hypothetical protein